MYQKINFAFDEGLKRTKHVAKIRSYFVISSYCFSDLWAESALEWLLVDSFGGTDTKFKLCSDLFSCEHVPN